MTFGTHSTEQATAGLPAVMGRRRHHRIACDLPTRFVIAATGQTGEARTVDIGLGGTRVDFPIEVVIPTDVQLTIAFPMGHHTEELELSARVVWTVTDRIEAPYATGLQFQDLPDAARRKLYDIIGELAD